LGTAGLSGVTIAVGIQAVRGINHLESKINSEAKQENVGMTFMMSDVKSVSILLTLIGLLLGLSSLSFAVMLGIDCVRRLSSRSHGSLKVIPPSTRTLRVQMYLLAFLCIWIMTVLIPTSIFVRTRWAKVSSSGSNFQAPVLSTNSNYWAYGFLRCLAAAPWFCFVVGVPATLVTTWAHFLSRTKQNPSKTSFSEDKL